MLALVMAGLPAAAQPQVDLAEQLGRAYLQGGRSAFVDVLVDQGWQTPAFVPARDTPAYQDVPPDAFTVFGSAWLRVRSPVRVA